MHAIDPVNRAMSAPVLSIGPDAPIQQALEIFLSHPVHHVPVVDADRHVVGMLSSADAMKLQFLFSMPIEPVGASEWTVGRLMNSPALVVTEHESLQRCAELMSDNAIHALPVVDRNEVLIGIVTTTDLMRCWLKAPPEAHRTDDAVVPAVTDERTRHALEAARRAVNTNHDPLSIAATLLRMEQRVHALEAVATAAKRYLNAGQDERLHVTLAKALEQADRFDESTRHPPVLGLS